MNREDHGIYRERYLQRLAEFGHDPRALGWTKGKQEERFSALTSRVDLTRAKSVLDVGCGFGDLFPFLTERGFRGRYVGIDFIDELLEVGRQAYPDAELTLADIDEFDACFCALYVSQDVVDGKKEFESIPERRPSEEERKQRSEAAASEDRPASFKTPVWRCVVCGYLCGRDEPPHSCPICKATADRFERFA